MRVRLSLFLIFALGLSMLLTIYTGATRVSAQEKSDAQAKPESVQVPIISPGSAYRQTNLISDIPGLAPIQDPLLVNPWGLTFRATTPFWVVNNGTSTTQLVRGNVGGAPFVLNPNPPGPQSVNIPNGLPTGAVGNSTSDFVIPASAAPSPTPPAPAPAPATFIFDSLTGNIAAWNNTSPTARIVVSNPGHEYTGLAIGSNSGGNRLYAADFANNHIDVFDGTFTATTVTGGFIDATIPAGYAPFNIQNLGGSLYVTYAKVGTGGHDAEGVGNGYVRKFNTDGVRDLTFAINNGALNSPWGLTIAPATFGIFGGALLVGNFGEGNPSIHAYNPSTGAFLGTLQDESGNGIVIDELWSLQFGNGGAGGDVNTLYFTAGTAEEEHGLFGKLNPTTAQATSLIQFATSNFSVDEGVGHVDFTVVRTGDTSGTATVNYNTFDESQAGHAFQKQDYETALGKLTFNPGETSKTFRILIVDDKTLEGDEVINLALSNPTGTGVGLGNPNQATVTILENDAVTATTNPIDDPTFFIRQHYLDFYNREPDANAAALVAQLTACGSDNACMQTRRRDISAQFFTSNDFFGNGSLILRSYKAAFGPSTLISPAPALYGQFELDLQAILNGVTIGNPSDPQLEANKQAFFASFVSRPTFVNAYPTTLTPDQFVDALIANTGATFTTAERQAAINEFGGASGTGDQAARARALRRIAENATFTQAEVARNSVALGFFGYERRDPDTTGFNEVLNRVNAFGGDFQKAGLINIFLQSSEYTQRFGPTSGRNPPCCVSSNNTGPTANNDTASTNVATPVNINVLANDTDPEGDYLTVQSVTPGTGGTPTISANARSVTFTPTAGFAGTATFQYTITDNGYNCAAPGCGPFGGITPNPITSTATVTITVASAGTFQFNAANATVNEGTSKVTLTVTRAGDTTVPVTVDYATTPDSGIVSCSTVNGLASERCDYQTAIGTLRFAAGDTSKTFDIFITDDARVEGNETFTVTLSNPTGTGFVLGGATTQTVTITDNDSTNGPNPIDATPFFVRQHYLDFLNREADTAGLNAWISTINNCASGNTSCDRVAVSSNFFLSAEYQGRGYFASRFYFAAFARNPTYREFVGDLSRLTGTTDAESASLKAAFAGDFTQRAEFHTTFDALTNAQYVDKLIANTGVTFPTATRDQFVADLNSSTKTRAQVLRDIVDASQFSGNTATFNRAFVLAQYFGYLRRDPDAAGFNAWLTFLNANPTSFRTMVNGFVNSAEYRLRFGVS